MTSHEALRVTIKLVGLALFIYGCINAITNLPIFLDALKLPDLDMPALSYLTVLIGPIFIGMLFWIFPSSVSNTIILNDLDTQSTDRLLPGIETILIRIMGIFLLFNCISALVGNYLTYSRANSIFNNMGSNMEKYIGHDQYIIGFITIGVEITMSLVLIFGARVIMSAIRKVRNVS